MKQCLNEISKKNVFTNKWFIWLFQVQIWLEKVFGDKSVPAYELNQYTLPVLYAVMKRNTEREKQTQLLVEEYRQKAEEYGVESEF